MAKAKRRSHKSGFSLVTNAPHSTTVIISVIVFVLGVLGAFVFLPILTPLSFWLALVGYLVLLAGCLMKGM
jgi:hypothetical protein